jgi:6-phosphogluconolactonase
MSRAAAEVIVEIAAHALESRGRITMALSGGSTPLALFSLLAQSPFRDQLPWGGMHFFWADERCVPPGDAESNYGQAQRALFDQVPLPPENLHRVQGELEPAHAAQHYVSELQRFAEGDLSWPRFDCVLLGMGSDGHTASLFPNRSNPAEQTSPAIAVTASYQGRPAQRVTLTPLAFNSARYVLFLVSGAEKADAVAAVLSGSYDPLRWPAQRIHPTDGTVIWIVDEAAARSLSVR